MISQYNGAGTVVMMIRKAKLKKKNDTLVIPESSNSSVNMSGDGANNVLAKEGQDWNIWIC